MTHIFRFLKYANYIFKRITHEHYFGQESLDSFRKLHFFNSAIGLFYYTVLSFPSVSGITTAYGKIGGMSTMAVFAKYKQKLIFGSSQLNLS